jgi:hypothetical protein
MRPTHRLILLALIILIFGTVPAINVQADATAFPPETIGTVICADTPQSHDGNISEPRQVDYWAIDLVAGQKLIIDVDAENIGMLDALLEVWDSDGTPVGWNNDQEGDDPADISLDPYLEVTVPSDGGDVTYYIAIRSGTTHPLDDRSTGPYTFFVQCSDSSTTPDPVPVEVGDLLGATGSDSASLLDIDPGDATSSLRFPLGIGPIADVEYQYSTHTLFVAINDSPGSVITIDPDTGMEGQVFNVDPGAVIALEDAASILYGVHVVIDEFSGEPLYSLVTIDQSTGELVFLASLGQRPYSALAYHSAERIMYGAASTTTGADLVKIDLTSFEMETVGPTGFGQIVALDFSHENVLYGVDLSGTLFYVPDLTTGQAEEIAPIDVSAEVMTLASAAAAPAGVSGLTFVVGEPPDVDPVITACSSTLTSPMTAGSEIAGRKLFGFKLKRHHKHRAVGFFKFQATAGESVTIRLAADEEIFAEAEKKSTVYKLWKHWSKSKRKGRAFLGLRDAIPGVKVKKKKKGRLPLELTVENLPADGWYYIMAVQPLFRYHKVDYRVDYHLTLDSGDPAAQACQTLEVVWPGDDAEEDFALTDESGDDYLRRGLR